MKNGTPDKLYRQDFKKLCGKVPERSVGIEGNKIATEFF